jgi:GNAT superfamily N-acetyltransferase
MIANRKTGEIMIRQAHPADEADWRLLWEGYNAFHETVVADEITSLTWRRMLDPDVPMIGRIAKDGGRPVGFSISVIHEGTWEKTPLCYLEDLFVSPNDRGKGIGRMLIRDLLNLAAVRGWSRLYWHTRQDNPARRLYDEFTEADGHVRYVLNCDDGSERELPF